MDAKIVVRDLAQHYLVNHDVSMQMQLGLPYLEQRNGKLYISFKPHKEVFGKKSVDIYEKMYLIKWEYPFRHVVYFEELTASADASKPVCSIKAEDFLYKGKRLYDELYDECSRVLSFMEKDNTVSELVMKKYQELYFKVIKELGLESVYGEI